jgi:signal transduction histidine kinase/CheY-like chemotaxis protein
MKKSTLSIRATLLAVISILNILIAVQVGASVYKSWINHESAVSLKKNAPVIDGLFNAEEFYSLERGVSMSLIQASSDSSDILIRQLADSRQKADKTLNQILSIIEARKTPGVSKDLGQVRASQEKLRAVRIRLDEALKNPGRLARAGLSTAVFDATTKLIVDVHALIESFSQPFMTINPAITRQLRFSHVVWNITEYAGREYALLGTALAENRFLTPDERRRLLVWQGRIEYGWELAHGVILTSNWTEDAKPALDEAETHYFMTFEQIKDVFNQSPSQGSRPSYPLTPAMWVDMASQAVDSLQAMNEAVLQVNRKFVEKINREAERNILVSILWFISVLLLSLYSWKVLMVRVIRPVNTMVNTLYKATQGERYELPAIKYSHDEIGKLASVLAVFQNNLQLLEDERDKANAANIAKSEFLANMSHEIRTPMNVVLGLTNILSRTKPLSDRQTEYIETLQLSAEALLSIINELLDVSKIETQSFELERIPFSLSHLIDETVTLMRVKADEKGLKFATDMTDIIGKTYVGDPTRIRQILTNLCGNAVKFTESGTITLGVACVKSDDLLHEKIYISVADTGIGIPPEKLNFIFDKFTQADSSISRKYGGTGLGLAIVKSFVEMMGGDIKVESVNGQGTVFTVFIPLEISTASVEHTQPQIEADDAKAVSDQPCVLLVEDHKPNVLVAGTYLETFGFTYDVAENGHMAILMAKQKKYHAILMDVQMQGMNGYQATQAIRSWEKEHEQPHIKIIGMTAYALSGDHEKCTAAGMDDYLSKPFDPEDLRKKLLNS